MHLQPAVGPILVNVPTNAYVTADEVHLNATVLGVRVDVIATPIRYRWTFGDGGTLTTTKRGHPYPNMTTTHTYTTTGTFPVTLTTTYTGRYRVSNDPTGTWTPVTGTADVPSPSTTLEVIETRAVLVP